MTDPFLQWIAAHFSDLAMTSVMLVLLYGGTQKWWAFGYQLTAAEQREANCKAEYEARLQAAQRREDEWKVLALEGSQVAKEAVGVARQRQRSAS